MNDGDWIRVRRGSVDQICAAAKEYASLYEPVSPHKVSAVVSRSFDKSFVVRFLGATPPYAFNNLLLWLDRPPGMPEVGDAQGWMTAPGSGIRYGLIPDHDNPDGDTLVGSSVEGQSIEVYSPECAVCLRNRPLGKTLTEPRLDLAALSGSVEIELLFDADTDFGNPPFSITHPPDNDWNSP